MNKQIYKGYLYAVISAIIFGCMPLMAKNIYAEGITPMSLVFMRNLLALPSLAALAWVQERSLAIPRQCLPSLGIISLVGCCATPILLFSSYQFIPSGTATVFHFIYPSIVVVAGVLFFKKKLQMSNIICVIICALGVALFYTPGEPLDLTGSVLSLASGFTYAAYILLISNFKHKSVTGFVFSFYVTAIAVPFALIACIVSGELVMPASLRAWLLCLLFAFLVTTGAVVLFQQAAFIIGGERSSILSTLEPTTGVIVGILVFHEAAGLRIIIGSVLVILASILIAVFDMKNKTAES